MMSLKKTLGFTFFLLIFFSNCSNNNDDTANNELIIYLEGNTKITLLEISDSRCPTNVDCVWQGNAQVDMRIVKENDTMDFTLNTAGYINENLDYPNSISIFDLNIELLDLLPYPEVDMTYELSDYNVMIEVTDL